MNLQEYIRDVPDFPKPGILFKDITPLLANPAAFRFVVESLANQYRGMPCDAVAAAEARGFIFAAPLALALDKPFVPLRKPGKLPYKTVSHAYALEYGTAELHMHTDAIEPGMRVLIIDDLLATGGTMKAGCELITKVGGTVVACAFMIELAFLGGRKTLAPFEVFSLLQYS